MIARSVVLALSALTLAACNAGPSPRDRYGRFLQPVAQPSKVVATELAFARAAQEDGQWTAFRDFSTGDAVMFVPQPVNAHDWLKQQDNPSKAVEWQPHEVWSSCDGSLAVTKGAWQRPNGTFGYFTTVWERQRDGEYKWVLDQGDVLAEPLEKPEFVQTAVADCDGEPQIVTIPFDRGYTSGDRYASRDNTLQVTWAARDRKERRLRAAIWKNGKSETVLASDVVAPQ